MSIVSHLHHLFHPETCQSYIGGVSNVDIDGNNILQIKAIGIVISTFETLPVHPCTA